MASEQVFETVEVSWMIEKHGRIIV